jgi:hypothetical protein
VDPATDVVLVVDRKGFAHADGGVGTSDSNAAQEQRKSADLKDSIGGERANAVTLV